MKVKILVISDIITLSVLIFLLIDRKEKTIKKPVLIANSGEIDDRRLGSKNHFEKIFYEKNDSVYRTVWGYSYKEAPIIALLLSTSYYNLCEKDIALKDINMAREQLEMIYHKDMPIVVKLR